MAVNKAVKSILPQKICVYILVKVDNFLEGNTYMDDKQTSFKAPHKMPLKWKYVRVMLYMLEELQ